MAESDVADECHQLERLEVMLRLVVHIGWEKDQDASHCVGRVKVDLRMDVEGVEVEACLEIDQQWIVDSRCLLHVGFVGSVVQRVKMNGHGIERMLAGEYEVQEMPF